ncbi:universal stress protein [Amycolatopsis sp. NPDC059657]|uniref:universal stress protein n=1 Tax=Amycolatopsis sp. NPDC059657 TaxID=3346899 RepID=UPI00366D458F
MMKTTTIVVGMDGSRQSEAALRWAIEEAGYRQGRVLALMVRPNAALLPGTSFAPQPHGRLPVLEATYPLPARIAAIRDEITGAAPVDATVLTGDPTAELVAASENADLLVVGAHRHGGAVGEILLGSVAAHCVRHAKCPVVVITPEASAKYQTV